MFKIDTRRLVFISLFTALIIAGGFVSVPVGPVPITFADFFIMLSAELQNPISAIISIFLYISLGLLGLPVFSAGKAGLGVITGPTGGFVLGYVFMTLIMSFSLYRKDGKKCKWGIWLASVLWANIALYASGVLGLMLNMSLDLKKAFFAGVLPFLPGTVLKILGSYSVYKRAKIWH